MNGYGGLIELVLVLSFVLGWGLLELRATRLDSRKARDAAAAEVAAAKMIPANTSRPADEESSGS